MSEHLMYKRIRNYAGFLGMILPFLALFSAGIAIHPDKSWWYSISATYYQSPALAAILTAASIVLMCYDGYDLIDNLVTSISGVFGIGIVLFPCNVHWIPDGTKVGFFQLPIEVSSILHCTCAGIFFVLLSINCLFFFTKHNGEMTENKKKRNVIYRVCGIGMFIFMLWQAITSNFGFPGWWTMINEIILLQFFGISWLVKGQVFGILKD